MRFLPATMAALDEPHTYDTAVRLTYVCMEVAGARPPVKNRTMSREIVENKSFRFPIAASQESGRWTSEEFFSGTILSSEHIARTEVRTSHKNSCGPYKSGTRF